MLSHRKKPTRNSMATMGTLSGFFTMSAKFGSSMDRPRKTTAAMAMIVAGFARQNPRERSAHRKRMAATVMKMRGSVAALTTSFRPETKPMRLSSSQWPGDAAVLAHPPEVDGHEDAGHERDSHAV